MGEGQAHAASVAALRTINLRFHDLRHEAGSRFIEAGWPIHHVSQMLGHSNLEQTSTVSTHGLQDSMRKYDVAGKVCNQVANSAAGDQPPVCESDTQERPQPAIN